jgi:hypothetical protein
VLRNRLRRDGYNPQTDAVNDALQAIKLVRANAQEWDFDSRTRSAGVHRARHDEAAPFYLMYQ